MSDKQKYCKGCRDDFYNGNNNLGVKQCWCLEKAKVVTRQFVHIDQRPPWTNKPEKTLDCHTRPKHIKVDQSVTR